MTYIRLGLGKSNLTVMNIYLIIEFTLLIYILLKIRSKQKGTENNYKLWAVIIVGGILVHLLDPIDKLHSAAMLYIALVYFHLSVGFIDLNKIDKLIKDPFSILHIAIFTKAFGYSYFLIYQIDYKFPLAIYSGVNLIVQILFAATIISYYKDRNSKIPDR
jgi:energy-converting hydrogenase Eha subunit C